MNLNAASHNTAALRGLTTLLDRLTREIKANTLRLKAGYNPGQPRVPAGDADGGQWTDGGGSGNLQAESHRQKRLPWASGQKRRAQA